MVRSLHNRSGFTLIELMISIVVVGIIATLATPELSRAWERQKFRGGNSALMSKIKLARSCAVSSKEPHGIYLASDLTFTVFRDVVNVGNGTFDDGDVVVAVDTLSEEFELLHTDNANGVIIFNSNGSASISGSGQIYTYGYSDGVLSMANITVLASTGRTSIDASYY